MNSQNGKNTFEDMKDMMRQTQTPQTYAMITEENWKNLIALLARQTSILEQQQNTLKTMITTEQMAEIMEDQATELQSYIQELEQTAESFNTEVTSQMEIVKDQTRNTMKEISSQAGRMSDDFSNSLSIEKKYMKDMFLRQRISSWILTAMQILSLGAFVLWVISQTF